MGERRMPDLLDRLARTEILLGAGITFLSAITALLAWRGADKEYVTMFGALDGQLIAGFLTYINATKGRGVDPKDQ